VGLGRIETVITTWSQGAGNEHMPEEILVDLSAIIRRHPWWRARARLTLALLERWKIDPPARVLDAGCGWGVTLEFLERRGYRAVGLDISRRALETLDRPGRELAEADLARPLPSGLEPYDAVVALDVIEHLDEDRAAVSRLGRLVHPGGVVVVSVPALPELFTEFDAIQGHRRRYLPWTLREAFADSGLLVEQVVWWGAWLVPILQWQRARLRSRAGETASQAYRRYLRLPPWSLPWGFHLAFAWEQGRAIDGRSRTGTSLFAVARRPFESPSAHPLTVPDRTGPRAGLPGSAL
jgi:2-polyprenyl-3-methyl-5-hydroxy-6-metoxy-1,4-benzoquinol methylase